MLWVFYLWERKKNLMLKYVLPVLLLLVILTCVYLIVKWQDGKHGVIEIDKDEDNIEFQKVTTDNAKNGTVFVYVAGGVVNPGVYELPEKSLVSDAISKAGGFSSDADMRLVGKLLNLAQRVDDGMKVYVPIVGDVAFSESIDKQESGKVNINTASRDELMELRGIGEVYSENIIEGRPYKSIEELVEKGVIPKATFDKIKDQITI